MQEERGQIVGDQVVSRGIDLWGSIVGNVTVKKGGKIYLRGNIYGNLTVLDGGRVHIFGNVTGSLLVKEGAKVILGGVVGKNIVNDGGRVFIEASAKVLGKVKTKDGETSIDPNSAIKEV